MCSSDRQQEAQVGQAGGSASQVLVLVHFVGSVQLVFPDDWQRVGLRVEDPVVQRELVVVGEEQVEVPAGDTHVNTKPVQQQGRETDFPSFPLQSLAGSIRRLSSAAGSHRR